MKIIVLHDRYNNEPIDVVMRRINAVENKDISRKEREVANEDKNCKPIRF